MSIDWKGMWRKTKRVVADFFRWHRGWVYNLQVKRDIDDYVMFWIFFGLGVALTLTFQWVF